jgi:hypothetical protein
MVWLVELGCTGGATGIIIVFLRLTEAIAIPKFLIVEFPQNLI